MVDSPFISVIIPVYNGEKFIVQALDSVRLQTYKSYEVRVTNNGSTDNTLKLLNQYSEKHPEFPMHIVSQENQGISGSRNTGVFSSKGEYVSFLDVDDFWYPNKLEAVAEYLRLYETLDVVWHRMMVCNILKNTKKAYKTHPLRKPFFEDILRRGNPLSPSCTTVRTSLAKQLGGFSMHLTSGEEDCDFWLRLAREGAEFSLINQFLSEYRIWDGNLSGVSNEKFEINNKAALAMFYTHIKYLEDNADSPEKIKRLSQIVTARQYFRQGRLYSQNKEFQKGLLKYIKAIGIRPLYWKHYAALLLNILHISY